MTVQHEGRRSEEPQLEGYEKPRFRILRPSLGPTVTSTINSGSNSPDRREERTSWVG